MSSPRFGKAAAFAALGLGVGFLKPVEGWGIAGVVAVLTEAVFELFNAQSEDAGDILESVDHGKDGIGSLIVEGLEFFARQHNGLYEQEAPKIPCRAR